MNKKQQTFPDEVKSKKVSKKSHCLKCFVAKCLWMVTVNMYDFMGLLDICPCATLHSTSPYISYNKKV